MFHEQVGLKIKQALTEIREVLTERKSEITNLREEMEQMEEFGPSEGLIELISGIQHFNSELHNIVAGIRNHDSDNMSGLIDVLIKSELPDLEVVIQKGALFKNDIQKIQDILNVEHLESRLDQIYEVCVDGLNYDVAKLLVS